MNRSLPVLLLLAACSEVPYQSAPTQYWKLYCDTCELEDIEDTYCTCVEEGTVTPDDFPKGYDYTSNEAELWCAAFLAELEYPGPSTAAFYKQSLEFLQQYENDACPSSGGDRDSG